MCYAGVGLGDREINRVLPGKQQVESVGMEKSLRTASSLCSYCCTLKATAVHLLRAWEAIPPLSHVCAQIITLAVSTFIP